MNSEQFMSNMARMRKFIIIKIKNVEKVNCQSERNVKASDAIYLSPQFSIFHQSPSTEDRRA